MFAGPGYDRTPADSDCTALALVVQQSLLLLVDTLEGVADSARTFANDCSPPLSRLPRRTQTPRWHRPAAARRQLGWAALLSRLPLPQWLPLQQLSQAVLPSYLQPCTVEAFDDSRGSSDVCIVCVFGEVHGLKKKLGNSSVSFLCINCVFGDVLGLKKNWETQVCLRLLGRQHSQAIMDHVIL